MNSEFERLVLEGMPEPQTFKPVALYDPDGDCLEFLISNESYLAERLDPLVTVYYGRQSKEIVGSLIKGVSGIFKRILDSSPGFRIEIQDGRIKLVHLFSACLWGLSRVPGQQDVKVYRRLREAAGQSDVEADLDHLALT